MGLRSLAFAANYVDNLLLASSGCSPGQDDDTAGYASPRCLRGNQSPP
jgi:hypothetical protein